MPGLRATSRASRAERARRLSEQFRLQLERPVPARPADLIGVEHEFTVHAGDTVLDFRELIHSLPVEGIRVDATDPNAYRCEWGGTITADGREAEIATPPVQVEPGFASAVEAWSRIGGASLRSVLPEGVETAGYSTHVNVQVEEPLNDVVCDGVIRRFVPALMLLTERAGSPGVLVRPRPGRVEVGTEFAEGPALRAASVLLAGAVRALSSAARGTRGVALPPTVKGRVLPASERFGWFIPHDSYGVGLAIGDGGRRLMTSRGSIRAGDQLEAAFEAALAALGPDLSSDDLDAVARVFASVGPMPADVVIRGSDGPPPTPFAALPRPPVRPSFDVRAAAVTWDLSIFHVVRGRRNAFASVPRDSLGSFLELLERGDLDEVVHDYLAIRSRDRVLSSPESATTPGLFDRVGALGDVLPRERAPGIPGGVEGDRPGKRDRGEQDDAKQRPRRRRPRWQAAAAAAAAAVVVVGGVSFALARGGRDATSSSVTPTALPSPTPSAVAPGVPRLAGTFSVGGTTWVFAPTCESGPCDAVLSADIPISPSESIPHTTRVEFTGDEYLLHDTGPGWCRIGDQVFRRGMTYVIDGVLTITQSSQAGEEVVATAFEIAGERTLTPATDAAVAAGCTPETGAVAGSGVLVG